MDNQRSIRSFFTPKSAPAKAKTDEGKSSGIKKKNLVINSDSEEDEQGAKENVPNQSAAAPEPNSSKSKPAAGDGDTVKQTSNCDAEEEQRETDLNLSVPHRKTARKSFKRSADEEPLQDEKNKKLKSEEKTTVKDEDKSIEMKADKLEEIKEDKPVVKEENPAVKEEIKPEAMEVEDSPVKSKSKRQRILSDSEDEVENKSPVKEKPKFKDEKSKNSPSATKSFSIFAKSSKPKSPVKVQSPEKSKSTSNTPKSETKSISSTKKSPDAKKSTEKPSKKSEVKSEVKKSADITPKSKKSESKSKKSTEKLKKSPVTKSKSPEAKDSAEKSPKPTSPKKEEDSPKPSTSGTQKPKNAFQGFFSSKQSGGGNKDAGKDYDKKVKKIQYNPIEDAFWKRGEKTPYLALASTLLAIEETSGRLRTIEMLSNYFRSVIVLNPEDLLPSVYMTLNQLAPSWEGLELGIGDATLLKTIGNTTGRSMAQLKADMERLGDVGIIAEQSKSSQRTMFQPAPLTVAAVFTRLREVATMTGSSSSVKKTDKIQSLLVACRGCEARYLVRSLAGKLRIGLAEQSVLQALAQACLQTPLLQSEFPPPVLTAFKTADSDNFKEKLSPLALKLKTAYCECPSYDLLIPALLESGIDKLKEKCKITPGIPMKPMLAHPTKGIQEVLTRFENLKFTCEWKYDGERAQVHMHEDGTINIYSRNQEDNTTKYPDVIARFANCMSESVKSFVLDSEAVAWDRETKIIQPFQVLSTRKRKDAVESEIKVQVALFGFDLLYLNGESLVRRSFQERRDLLRQHFKEVEGEFFFAKGVDGTTTEEIQVALEDSIKDNCEGLMVKTLDQEATYEIARRSHNWLKLKKDYLEGVGDTIDLVVIGGYKGKGKRTGGYGGFLLACYDAENEEYQTICKIGTGFSDDDLAKHAAFFKEHVIEKAKGYYSYDSGHEPDHWFEPVQVWEVKCADISISPVHKAAMGLVDPSKGVSLRFPRFICIREDKNTEDATSAEQIAEMYNNQDQIKNNKNTKASNPEDDFDF